MKNLEVVRNACIKAVPEIMELKFGCEVVADVGGYENLKVLGEIGICKKHKRCQGEKDNCDITDGLFLYYDTDDGSYTTQAEQSKIKEILGRPIQLADVLRAIYAKGLDMKTRLNIECDGQFLVWHPEQDHKTLGPTWNLSKDLSGQSEETLAFLSTLLK